MTGKSICQKRKKVPPCEDDTVSKKDVGLKTASFRLEISV